MGTKKLTLLPNDTIFLSSRMIDDNSSNIKSFLLEHRDDGVDSKANKFVIIVPYVTLLG